MEVPEIVQDGAPVLRGVAAPVPETLFGTPELKKIIDAMAQALDGEPDGVAIAAPQIALPYRLFLVRYDRVMEPPAEGEPPHAPEIGVYANPSFVKTSRKRSIMDEGCLSVRGFYGKTMRHERATVRAQDASGAAFERGGGGLLAQIFQHERDHLNGILFIDHAQDITRLKKRKHSPEDAEHAEADGEHEG
jgi:peptide deformylase